MGRPERPIDPEDRSPQAEFARGLRELRATASTPPPTYEALSQDTHYGTSTLSKALSGRGKPPTKAVVLALVECLGGDLEEWVDRYEAAFESAASTAKGPDQPNPEVTDRAPEIAELHDETAEQPSTLSPVLGHPLPKRRRIIAATAAATGGLVLVVGVGSFIDRVRQGEPSSAEGLSQLYAINAAQVPMRNCPTSDCEVLARWPTGTSVRMICFHDDANAVSYNYRSPRWFNVVEAATATAGWVHSSQVGRQIGVSGC